MKTISVYVGQGAYQAKDIENFLAVFDFDYKRVSEEMLTNLDQSGILIVPGGEIKSFLPAWGTRGVEAIRKFVADGGVYIGICSGAYIAGESFNGVPGLAFFPKILRYTKHQATIDVTDEVGHAWQLVAENGPDLSSLDVEKVILKDATTGKPQAVQIKFGRGMVYLFASHPEGSIFYGQFPQNFSGAQFFNQFLKALSAA